MGGISVAIFQHATLQRTSLHVHGSLGGLQHLLECSGVCWTQGRHARYKLDTRPAFSPRLPTCSDEEVHSPLQQLPFAIAALPTLTRVAAKCCAPDPCLGGVILNYKVIPIYDLFQHSKSKLVLLFLWCFIQLVIINKTITKSRGSDNKDCPYICFLWPW